MVSFSLLNAIDPTTIIFIVLLALLIVALLVVPMFTNKKRAKQTDELHRSLKPGDLVKTIGGIVGTIIEIRKISPVDTEMVIETGVGDNKTTMVLDIQALYQVISRSSTIVSANDKEEETAEENTADKEQPVVEEPVKEVPPIMADRTPESEAAEKTEDQPAKEESTEAVKDDVIAEQAAVKEEPKAAPAKKTSGTAKKPAGGAKKTTSSAKKTNK